MKRGEIRNRTHGAPIVVDNKEAGVVRFFQLSDSDKEIALHSANSI